MRSNLATGVPLLNGTGSGVAGSGARGGAYVLVLLVLIYCASFLDRNIIALLAVPIEGALGISNTRVGLLFGLGFGLLYSMVALPLAQWVDRGQRIWIVTFAVALWSLSTIASAFASSFAALAVCRAGVAFGEAVLSPAAISLIADLYPRDRRTLPTSIYNTVGPVMGYAAYFLGGAALDLATRVDQGYGLGLAPWRLTLVLVGLPGLVVVSLLRVTVREPPRSRDRPEEGDYASVRQGLGYVLNHFRLYGFLFLGMAGVTTGIIGFISWLPTLLIRGYGTTGAEAGYLVGSIATLGGISGSIFWPLITSAWTARGRKDAPVVLIGVGAACACLSILAAGLVHREAWTLAASGVAAFAGGSVSVLPPLVIQYVAPGQMRGRLMALNLLPTNLVGMTLGPFAVAVLSEHLFSGRFALGSGIATVALVVAPSSVYFFAKARAGYLRALAGVSP